MPRFRVHFLPIDKAVMVEPHTTLLEAAGKARITLGSVCGGDGVCGRCKMIIVEGDVGGQGSLLLSSEEVRRGVVLACQATVESDLIVEIPEETRAKDKIVIDRDAQRFRADRPGVPQRELAKSPLVAKIYLELKAPTLDDSISDCERVRMHIGRLTGISPIQTGLKTIRRIPDVLREHDFRVTAMVGMRHGVTEIIDLEGGDTSANNFAAVVDVGTSTVVVHLVDAVKMTTVDAAACFNSQAMHGREVTARIIAAERRGVEHLQRLLVDDINGLISALAGKNRVNLKDITAVVCAGNTAMMHFLLGLPTQNIRRKPFIAVTVEPPPFRAAEVGIEINPRGLLFVVPGIGGWVGGDITAGILATGLHEMREVGMLIDVGTNGEIVLGNRDWLVACSASAGPALEGAGVACGMMAQEGAIETVEIEGGHLRYEVIGGGVPDGICGSGIIDLIAALLKKGVIDRAGAFVPGSDPAVRFENGRGRFVVASPRETLKGNEIVLDQDDVDNVVTAKAAIFAAARIMMERLKLEFCDIRTLFIAGGFGSYINVRNAIAIGLFPDLPLKRIRYVGNTSIGGAKLAALSNQARGALRDISRRTTYYDLLGSRDYVEQFEQARFLPHTNIELFPSVLERVGAKGGAE